jgi:hypothetical protein
MEANGSMVVVRENLTFTLRLEDTKLVNQTEDEVVFWTKMSLLAEFFVFYLFSGGRQHFWRKMTFLGRRQHFWQKATFLAEGDIFGRRQYFCGRQHFRQNTTLSAEDN